MANDKPSVNLTLASLEAEIAAPEPFILALRGGKRITFPDLYGMPVDEAEEFFKDFNPNSGKNDLNLLEKWLSAADFEAYKAAKIPLRVHGALLERVTNYYQQTVGKPGEDSASKS